MNNSETSKYHITDISNKKTTYRRAVAVGVFYPGEAFDHIINDKLPKGNALVIAEIAGLQGAKKTPELLPLCHPIMLDSTNLRLVPDKVTKTIRVYAETVYLGKTGVEMEALTAVNIALLTLYDLTKPVEPALSIGNVRLLFKQGGKKGLWIHPDSMTESEKDFYGIDL